MPISNTSISLAPQGVEKKTAVNTKASTDDFSNDNYEQVEARLRQDHSSDQLDTESDAQLESQAQAGVNPAQSRQPMKQPEPVLAAHQLSDDQQDALNVIDDLDLVEQDTAMQEGFETKRFNKSKNVVDTQLTDTQVSNTVEPITTSIQSSQIEGPDVEQRQVIADLPTTADTIDQSQADLIIDSPELTAKDIDPSALTAAYGPILKERATVDVIPWDDTMGEVDTDAEGLLAQTSSKSSDEQTRLQLKGLQVVAEQLTLENPTDAADPVSFEASELALTNRASMSSRSDLAATTTVNQTPIEMSLNKPVQSPDWSEKVFERIRWMASGELQKAEIRLDPPDLGPLKLEIQVKNDQTQIILTSHSSQVREILEQQLPRLREMLEAQGFTSVDAQTRDSQDQKPTPHQSNARSTMASSESETEINQHESMILLEKPGKGRVDCYI